MGSFLSLSFTFQSIVELPILSKEIRLQIFLETLHLKSNKLSSMYQTKHLNILCEIFILDVKILLSLFVNINGISTFKMRIWQIKFSIVWLVHTVYVEMFDLISCVIHFEIRFLLTVPHCTTVGKTKRERQIKSNLF